MKIKNHSKKTLLIALIIIVIMLLNYSCSRKLIRSIEKTQTNTTTIIDTLVRTVPDSSVIRAYFKCDSNNRVTLSQLHQLQTENSSNELLIDSLGRIEVKTRWRTQVIERERIVRDTITRFETVDIEKRIPYIPSFVWWLISSLILACAVMGYFIIRKIF